MVPPSLPNIEEFADKLSEAGIDEHTTVIAYDSQAGANAAVYGGYVTM